MNIDPVCGMKLKTNSSHLSLKGRDIISVQTGAELVKKFKDPFLNEHYLAHKMDDVIKIKKQEDEFEIVTKKQERFLSHAVSIATGMKKGLSS